MTAAEHPLGADESFGRLLTGRSLRIALPSLFGLAIVLRIVLKLGFGRIADPQLWEFDDIARTLLETGLYTYRSNGVPDAYMPPGYPLLIALLYRLFGIGLAAHTVLALLLLCFEIALPLLVGWVGMLVWNRTVGVVAFVLALFWPYFLIMSGTFSDVQICATLLVAACGILFTPSLSPPRRTLLSGLALGMFANFRFDAPVYALPFLYHIVRSPVPGGRWWSARSARVAIFLLAFIVPLSPWLVRNYLVFHTAVVSTSGGFNLRRGHHEFASGTPRDPERAKTASPGDTVGTAVPGAEQVRAIVERSPADVLRADRVYRDLALRYIADHPAREIELGGRKLFYFLVADFTHPVARLAPVWLPSLVALLLGFSFWVKTGSRSLNGQMLWMIFGIQAGVAVVFFVLPRYRIVVDFIPLLFFAGWIGTVVLPWACARRGTSRVTMG